MHLQLNQMGRSLIENINRSMLNDLQQVIDEKNFGNVRDIPVYKVKLESYGIFKFEWEMEVCKVTSANTYQSPFTSYSSTNTSTTMPISNLNSTNSSGVIYSNGNSNAITINVPQIDKLESLRVNFAIDGKFIFDCADRLVLSEGKDITIEMPDGSLLMVDEKGNFVIEDKDSKVTYRGNRIREFNRYINSSDLLQDFIRFLGKNGVRQSEALSVPVELFVNWLIMNAAEADGEAIPEDMIPVERHPRLVECKRKTVIGKCLRCGKFISHDKIRSGFNFCNIEHAQEHCDRLQLAS